jgi:hypothetical protein
MKDAIQTNKMLVSKSLQAIKKNPVFGQEAQYNQALVLMKDLNE